MLERTGNPSEAQALPTPIGKPVVKPVKSVKKKTEPDGIYLPLLAEFIFTFSVILVSVVFLAMSFVSWLNGATLVDFLLRTSLAVVVQGSILIIVSKQVSTGVLQATKDEMEEENTRDLLDEQDSSDDVDDTQATAEAQ